MKINKNLQKWIKKLCEKNALDIKTIDWESIIDSTLTNSENKAIIKEKLKSVMVLDIKEEYEKAKIQKEKQETELLQQLKKDEKMAKKEMNKAVKKILQTQSKEVTQFFAPAKEYIKAVLHSKGNLNSLFICGRGGIGKSTVVLTTIEEEKQKYIYISSYSTVVELVNFLYEHRKDNIVFDDFEVLLKNEIAINILKPALWGVGTQNKRIISYLTTSKRLTAPQQFEFEGKCFFCLNQLPNKERPLIKALLSRSLIYNLDFEYAELIKLLAEITKTPYRNLSEQERTQIFEYIKKNSDQTCEDLNIRTLIKAFDIYIENKEKWQELVKPLLAKDEKLWLLKKYITENNTIREAQQKWTETTGLGRTSFFIYRQRIQ